MIFRKNLMEQNKDIVTSGNIDEGLPPFVSYLFREIDEKNINVNIHKNYVIDRVLENGDDRSIAWCLATYDRETLSDAVMSSSFITPSTANLWSLVLDIPEGKIQCLRDISMRKAKASF
jgi:hypothetical protein